MLLLGNELFRVIYIGLCFTVLFSSDFTILNLQKTLTVSIAEENPDYNIDGYVSLGLTYAVYGIMLWFAPSVISITGPKLGIVLGSIGFVLMAFSLTLERVWVTYLGMVVAGVGGSILWVAEGNYMVLISGPTTMPRNVGIFWVFFCASFIFGNVYTTVELAGKDRIDYGTRHSLLYVLTAVCSVAAVMLCLLPTPERNRFAGDADAAAAAAAEPPMGPVTALKKTWHLFWKRNTLILLVTFCYAGFQQSFGQGIYGACIGFTRKFGADNKHLVPLSGVIYGVGDLLGGSLQACLNKVAERRIGFWPKLVISTGCSLQILACVFIFVNVPNRSVFGETDDVALIEPSVPLAMASSFLIGVGDSCLNTQIFPLIASLEPNYSTQTCALYKFMKSMAMAAFFFASPYLGLHVQLIVIIAVGLMGAGAFLFVETSHKNQKKKVEPKRSATSN